MLAVPIRVLIADTQPIVLEGLRSVLSPSGIHVIGEAFDGIEAITKTIDLGPVDLMTLYPPSLASPTTPGPNVALIIELAE